VEPSCGEWAVQGLTCSVGWLVVMRCWTATTMTVGDAAGMFCCFDGVEMLSVPSLPLAPQTGYHCDLLQLPTLRENLSHYRQC
jgi:hypothetical protein